MLPSLCRAAINSPWVEILNEFRMSLQLGAELLVCPLDVGQECLVGEDGIPDDILRRADVVVDQAGVHEKTVIAHAK